MSKLLILFLLWTVIYGIYVCFSTAIWIDELDNQELNFEKQLAKLRLDFINEQSAPTPAQEVGNE